MGACALISCAQMISSHLLLAYDTTAAELFVGSTNVRASQRAPAALYMNNCASPDRAMRNQQPMHGLTCVNVWQPASHIVAWILGTDDSVEA